MQGARARGGGGGWTNLRHTPLPPNAKKKNRDPTIDFILKY